MKKEKITAIIESMPEEEQIALHNEIETDCNGEFQIYSMDEFDEVLFGLTPTEIAQKVFFGNFRWGRKYFQSDGYGNLTSFDSPSYYDARFYPSDLAEEIVLSGNSYGYEAIQAVLDED